MMTVTVLVGRDPRPSIQKKRGRILHQALYFVEKKEDLAAPSSVVKKAFFSLGERMRGWDVEHDFETPLKGLLKLKEIDLFFPQKSLMILKEREFIEPCKQGSTLKVHRPDRVVVYDDKCVVVEYKGEEGEKYYDLHEKQLLTYKDIVEKVFLKPVEPYLLYVQRRRCIRL